MNKIALITWLNGRKELSAKVLRYFSQFDLSHFIAIGTDCQDVCKGTKFKYTECENDPLGNKWNEAFRQLKGLEPLSVILKTNILTKLNYPSHNF